MSEAKQEQPESRGVSAIKLVERLGSVIDNLDSSVTIFNMEASLGGVGRLELFAIEENRTLARPYGRPESFEEAVPKETTLGEDTKTTNKDNMYLRRVGIVGSDSVRKVAWLSQMGFFETYDEAIGMVSPGASLQPKVDNRSDFCLEPTVLPEVRIATSRPADMSRNYRHKRTGRVIRKGNRVDSWARSRLLVLLCHIPKKFRRGPRSKLADSHGFSYFANLFCLENRSIIGFEMLTAKGTLGAMWVNLWLCWLV